MIPLLVDLGLDMEGMLGEVLNGMHFDPENKLHLGLLLVDQLNQSNQRASGKQKK